MSVRTATNDALYRIDVSTGAGTLIGDMGLPDVFGLATGDDGILYAVAGTSIYSINPGTAESTLVASWDGSVLSAALGAAFVGEHRHSEVRASIPAPGTLALLSGCGRPQQYADALEPIGTTADRPSTGPQGRRRRAGRRSIN